MHEILAQTRALILAVAVHIIMAAIVVLGTMDWQPFRPPAITGLTIEAVMVDTKVLKDRREKAQREADQALQRKIEKERRERELEERRKREEEAEKQRQKDQAIKKRDEDLRLQKLRKKQEQDRKDRLKRQQDELKDLRRKREEAARQRKFEEERLKQLDARRQAERDAQLQAKAESDRLAAEQQEFRAGRLATLGEQYYLAIQAQVTNNWFRPPTARSGLRCTLRIVQIPGGEVISANIAGKCTADEATRRSLVAAVERAGSLPYCGFEKVFEREIDFIFKYDGD